MSAVALQPSASSAQFESVPFPYRYVDDLLEANEYGRSADRAPAGTTNRRRAIAGPRLGRRTVRASARTASETIERDGAQTRQVRERPVAVLTSAPDRFGERHRRLFFAAPRDVERRTTALLLQPIGAGSSGRDAVANGSDALRRQAYDDAIFHLGRAVALDPGDMDAHVLLGLAYSRRDAEGDLARASREFGLALLFEADDHETRLHLGLVFLKRGEWARAARELERARRHDERARLRSAPRREPFPTSVRAILLTALGYCELQADSFAAAAAALRAARRLAPEEPVTAWYLGEAAYFEAKKGDGLDDDARTELLRESLAAFRSVPAGVADTEQLHSNLGCVLEELGRDDEARVEYERAIESGAASGSLDPIARLNLAGFYLRRSRLDEARPIYEALTRTNGDEPKVHVHLGLTYARLGRDRDAETALERALELDPENVTALHTLATLRYHEGRTSASRDLLARAIEADASDDFARRMLEAIEASEPRAEFVSLAEPALVSRESLGTVLCVDLDAHEPDSVRRWVDDAEARSRIERLPPPAIVLYGDAGAIARYDDEQGTVSRVALPERLRDAVDEARRDYVLRSIRKTSGRRVSVGGAFKAPSRRTRANTWDQPVAPIEARVVRVDAEEAAETTYSEDPRHATEDALERFLTAAGLFGRDDPAGD